VYIIIYQGLENVATFFIKTKIIYLMLEVFRGQYPIPKVSRLHLWQSCNSAECFQIPGQLLSAKSNVRPWSLGLNTCGLQWAREWLLIDYLDKINIPGLRFNPEEQFWSSSCLVWKSICTKLSSHKFIQSSASSAPVECRTDGLIRHACPMCCWKL